MRKTCLKAVSENSIYKGLKQSMTNLIPSVKDREIRLFLQSFHSEDETNQ